MNDQQLRDLLLERADHLGPADLVGGDVVGRAWSAGRSARRRTAWTTAAAGALVVAAVVVPGVLATRFGDPAGRGPAQGPGASPAASAEVRVGQFVMSVDEGPRLAAEAGLPRAASPLPAALPALPALLDPVPTAPPGAALLAVGQVEADGPGWRVLLLTDDGWRAVDTSRLRPYADAAPLVEQMLSPDGRRLAFPQAGAVEVLDLLDGSWQRLAAGADDPSTARWVDDAVLVTSSTGSRYRTPRTVHRVGGSSSGGAVGPAGVDVDGSGPDGSGLGGGPGTQPRSAAYVAPGGTGEVAQGFEDPSGSTHLQVGRADGDQARLVFGRIQDPERPGSCCTVVGWLDDAHVLYLSRGPQPRLLAWAPRLGTDPGPGDDGPAVARVTDLTGLGEGDLVGVADLSRVARGASSG